MTTNLPRRYDTGALAPAPSPLSRAGRIERRTRHDVHEMTAQHYKNLIDTQQKADEKAADIGAAIYLEGVLHAGLADFGDAVTTRLNGASDLSRTLVAESLAGSVARINRAANRANS